MQTPSQPVIILSPHFEANGEVIYTHFFTPVSELTGNSDLRKFENINHDNPDGLIASLWQAFSEVVMRAKFHGVSIKPMRLDNNELEVLTTLCKHHGVNLE
jgi:hypothetical protein